MFLAHAGLKRRLGVGWPLWVPDSGPELSPLADSQLLSSKVCDSLLQSPPGRWVGITISKLIGAKVVDCCCFSEPVLGFSSCCLDTSPREVHLEFALQIMGYLQKYPKRGYVVNPTSPHFDQEYLDAEVKCDFGNQYLYFWEELDSKTPVALC
jgi:hypothetical protein